MTPIEIPWIECGLPFDDAGDTYAEFPPPPSTDDKQRELFGTTLDELDPKIDSDAEAALDMAVDAELYSQFDLSEEDGFRAFRKAVNAEVDRRLPPDQAALITKRSEIQKWAKEQPQDPIWEEATKEVADANKLLTFCGRGLNQPGVEIELTDGKRHLIGTINKFGGTCDDCTAFPGDTIIARYRAILWTGAK